MSDPDFERARYVEPKVIEGEVVLPSYERVGGDEPIYRRVQSGAGALPRALGLGLIAAVVGALAYGLIGLSGFMVSIVAIGIGWLVGKAMMTGSNGVGGQTYQAAACVLTYFAVSCGQLLHPLYRLHLQGAPASMLISPLILKYAALGPFLELQGNGFNGALGLLILFFGMRTAWRTAAGGPGFQLGRGGTRNPDPFNLR